MNTTNTPIVYLPHFVEDHEKVFDVLWSELGWVEDFGAPRKEYYCNDIKLPYTYGSGNGVRTYEVQNWHPAILDIRKKLEEWTGTVFEVCFANGYRDNRDHLGYHADDSPEMDDSRPIAIVSLGARREIYFRQNAQEAVRLAVANHDESAFESREIARAELIKSTVGFNGMSEKVWLESGSLCLMLPGMQDTHQHKIPKASYQCGPRISLTFRGYLKK
jgi:alkylated DNA repair dioxygenase AlkB